ncbi:hypothetical protein [Streptomyces sp. NPDC093225]|uniref:hypothetical protein n=1 Tax=Streptomyces sp. NPDC093225 TaxID=3366034 RepID=UPI00382E6256
MHPRTADLSLRAVAAACALLSAVDHLYLAPEHLEEMPYMGILFLIGGTGLLVVAAGLALTDPRPAWVGGALLNAGMLLGFALSRTVGLPDYHETGWEPPHGVLSVASEAVFLLAAAAWYVVVRRSPDRGPAGRIAGRTPHVHDRGPASHARLR